MKTVLQYAGDRLCAHRIHTRDTPLWRNNFLLVTPARCRRCDARYVTSPIAVFAMGWIVFIISVITLVVLDMVLR